MNQPFYKIFDNIFPSALTNTIEEVVFNSLSYQGIDLSPNWKVNSNLSNSNSKDMGLNYLVWDKNNYSYDNTFFYLNPLYYFTNKLNLIITQIIMTRMYLQFPSNQANAEIHTDNNIENKGKIMPDPNVGILLYYVNDSEGDTILYKNDRKTEVLKVTPKKGRCVFFSNLIPHKAGIPKKSPRAVINYNFKYCNPQLDKKN